ncbi:hypothetical protein ECE50_008710 [Chitinophaga sp. Mgbs1]|uniref:Uncharacterized protein n=1 Tax=Chitinophaga solisilvae TaxID=1233460 RepID=A0A9Q5D3D7_9BACT|nr:hypothetical protein [Chitinophaga solisilvae]
MNEFIGNDKDEFVQAFTEFGMQFENKYSVQDILQKIFYARAENGIVEFSQTPDAGHFKAILDAYYWLNLAFVKSYQEEQELKGEFFQDVVFASLLAYCFYPQALAKTVNYLEAEYKESFKAEADRKAPEQRKYDRYYGYGDIFQLLKVLVSDNHKGAFVEMISGTVETHYEFAIRNFLSEDPGVVNEVLEMLAQFHVNNKGESYLDTLNHDCWKVFPLEMMGVVICRQRKGLSNAGVSHPLIAAFLPFVFETESLPADELTRKLELKII